MTITRSENSTIQPSFQAWLALEWYSTPGMWPAGLEEKKNEKKSTMVLIHLIYSNS